MGKFESAMSAIYEVMICERKTMALQLMDEISSGDTINDIRATIEQYGGNFLGSGYYSQVFSGSVGGYVIKLSTNDEGFMEYYDIIQSKNNPLFPEIVAHKSFEADEFGTVVDLDIYIMGRLIVEVDKLNKPFLLELGELMLQQGLIDEEFVENFGPYLSLNQLISIFMRHPNPKQLLDVDLFNQFFNKYHVSVDNLMDFAKDMRTVTSQTLDVHRENFGFDGKGRLVIFDPLSFDN